MMQLNLGKIANIETEITTDTIIGALQKYKAEHIADYLVAVEGYKKAFEENHKEAIKKMKAVTFETGSPYVQQNFGLTKPINNEAMYDQFIVAFNSLNTQVLKLTLDQVNTIMNNSWEWVGTANASMASYNSKFYGANFVG